MNINEEIEKEELAGNQDSAEDTAEDEAADIFEDTAEQDESSDSEELNYEPIIGSYTHDDMFSQLIKQAKERSAEKARKEQEKKAAEKVENAAEPVAVSQDGNEVHESSTEDDPIIQDTDHETDDGGESTDEVSEEDLETDEESIVKETEELFQTDARETEEDNEPDEVLEEKEEQNQESIAEKIKNSQVIKPAVIKEMFFGSRDSEHKFAPDDSETEENDEFEDPVEFERSRRKRAAADPERDKKIFSIEYMLDPESAADGYMLFYNEFILKKNIKITLILGFLALIFLFSVVIAPKGYLNYTLLLLTLSIIAMRWINSSGAKRDALLSAEDVKNDSYRLDFYNSRILLKASEIVDDKIYSYPPVMIRFEDIELKVLDYEELYVLIFKKNYVYTIPKSAMNEEQRGVFKGMLENILGDDYYEFYSREKEAEERAEKRRQKKDAKTGKKSDQ